MTERRRAGRGGGPARAGPIPLPPARRRDCAQRRV